MMYPFITLYDSTEIVHSEIRPDGTVKVYVEKPDAADGFHNACCILPGYQWQEVFGFSSDEIVRYEKFIRSTAHLIFQFSQRPDVSMGKFQNSGTEVSPGK